ncbi:sugar lactone lactonase YvrE [Lysobacter sp. OAE881]|uniref:hypothetical protein n=1 Tax=Lysobacter sp. OAE881 TaxID=2663813 RepID=UPI0033934CA6
MAIPRSRAKTWSSWSKASPCSSPVRVAAWDLHAWASIRSPLSADGETLYFGSMNGTSWYSVPARLFRDGASDAEIGRGIVRAGSKPLSDGAATDAEGNHFITNLPDNGIDLLTKDGKLQPLVRDPRFLWADNAHFGQDSWLYVAINQLHRNPIFTGAEDRGQPPYLIARIWTGTRGQPGR